MTHKNQYPFFDSEVKKETKSPSVINVYDSPIIKKGIKIFNRLINENLEIFVTYPLSIINKGM